MDNIFGEHVGALVFFLAVGVLSFIVWRFVSALRSQGLAVREKTKRNARISVICVGVLAAGAWLVSALYNEIDLHTGNEGRYATRDGQTIYLHPSGVTFHVPKDWLGWDSQFHNNFHLSHEQLRRVRVGSGEWDSEYGEVVNASLPFEQCAAHVGGEGWGAQGTSFGDLQVRAYVSDFSATDILGRIRTSGLDAARKAASPPGSWVNTEVELKLAEKKGWKIATISYPLWYGDYGGTAVVDFEIADVGRYRLVLVFMGWGYEGEKDVILNSVSFPSGSPKTLTTSPPAPSSPPR